MDELRRAMLDAGAPRDEWQADLTTLMAAGQQRVRKRRMVATGLAAAVVTVVGTTAALAGVPGLNKSDPDPVKDRHSGVYVEERLSPAEVERRCNIVLDKQLSEKTQTWVAGVGKNRRAVRADDSTRPIETRVGYVVELGPPGTKLQGDGSDGPVVQAEVSNGEERTALCTIPQLGELDSVGARPEGSLPSPDDARRIADHCSDHGGYDVRGWELLIAADLAGIEAVFMSDNGYVASCAISPDGVDLELDDRRLADDEGRPLLPADDTGRRDPDRYQRLTLSCAGSSGSTVISCSDVGVIPGLPDGYRVEVTLPDGSVRSATTKRGAYALSIELSDAGAADAELPIRVRASDGVVVWKSTPGTGAGGGGGGGGSGGGGGAGGAGGKGGVEIPPTPPARRP